MFICLIYRAEAHRKELSAPVAELPPAGRSTGEYYAGGAAFDYGAAC